MADDIKSCRDLDEHLAPYVDGEETPSARRSVEAHLSACPPCQGHVAAETTARDIVRDHRDGLRVGAPHALRARCAALQSSAGNRQSARAVSLVRRWVPLSLAATLVLAVAGVFVLGLNNRVEALAASLTVDHVKCFKVAGRGGHAEAPAAERDWQQDQGWPIVVPQSSPGQQLTLVDVRRCFSTDGRAAHMMYTWRGAPLSVYVLQEADGNAGRDRVVDKMGHEAVIWCANRRTYAVVAEGHPQDLSQVVDYMKAHVR
jgi:anti-sigma factor RsiW